MISNSLSIVGIWTDGPVGLLAVWYWPDHQMDKNWDKITSRVFTRTQQWTERKLPIKGWVAMAIAYIASFINYRLTVVPCSGLIFTKLERMLSEVGVFAEKKLSGDRACHFLSIPATWKAFIAYKVLT